jgi:formylglycine-generating enzyme required for sulfatase activity
MKNKFFIILFSLLLLAGCTPVDCFSEFNKIENRIVNKISTIKSARENKPETIIKNLRAIVEISSNQYSQTAENHDYINTYNSINNMTLVYIPAGEFLMGSSGDDAGRYEDEEPQHTVYLDSYWISKTQITNAMFTECVNAEVCKYSVNNKTDPAFQDSEYADHPVVYITWGMAQTYCGWTGGRLPTEAEWEKAARGPRGAMFSWGNEIPTEMKFASNINNMIGDTTPVGLFLYGSSYYGVMDMGGNVREWVLDWYDPDYYENSPSKNPQGPETGEKKVLKGASYLDPLNYARAANRLTHEPDSPGAIRGFRCAYKEATTLNTSFLISN